VHKHKFMLPVRYVRVCGPRPKVSIQTQPCATCLEPFGCREQTYLFWSTCSATNATNNLQTMVPHPTKSPRAPPRKHEFTCTSGKQFDSMCSYIRTPTALRGHAYEEPIRKQVNNLTAYHTNHLQTGILTLCSSFSPAGSSHDTSNI